MSRDTIARGALDHFQKQLHVLIWIISTDLADLSIDKSQYTTVQEPETKPRNNGLMKGFPVPPRQPRDITSDFAKASLGQSSSFLYSANITYSLGECFTRLFKEGLQGLVVQ